jgi:hypothetical protein
MRFFGVATAAGSAAGELFSGEFFARPKLRNIGRTLRLRLSPGEVQGKGAGDASEHSSDEKNTS